MFNEAERPFSSSDGTSKKVAQSFLNPVPRRVFFASLGKSLGRAVLCLWSIARLRLAGPLISGVSFPGLSGCNRQDAEESPRIPTSLGAIAQFSEGVNPVPLYRVSVVREGNFYHALSLICTHQTCVLLVRADGRGFDCPCHGSRFARNGAVEIGPAVKPLPHYRLSERGGELFVELSETVSAEWRLKV